MWTMPHQVSKRTCSVVTKRALPVGPPARLKQPHVTHHSAKEDASMSRAQAQEASYPFKVHSMKSLKKTALTVSCKQLLSFMPVPGRITMQPFKKSSPAPRMPNRMKVGAQQGLISQVNLRSCMSALLSGEKLVSPLPGTHLPPMMLLHPRWSQPPTPTECSHVASCCLPCGPSGRPRQG